MRGGFRSYVLWPIEALQLLHRLTKYKWAKILFGILFIASPFVWAFQFRHYTMDFATFVDWGKKIGVHPENVYTETSANYPIIGVTASAGIARLSGSLGFDPLVVMKYFLASVDLMNSILIAVILLLLNVPNAFLWALFLYFLPSTWTGTIAWLQIDGVTQMFILLSLVASALAIKAVHAAPNAPKKWVATGWLMLSLSSMIGGVFTKQIIIFSLPVLLFVFAVATFAYFYRFKTFAYPAFFGVLIFNFVFFLVLDRAIFKVPEPFSSQLSFILLGGGSDHGNTLSMNGLNLWRLIFDQPLGPSTTPLWKNLTPKLIGEILFILSSTYFFLSFASRLFQLFKARSNPKTFNSFFALSLLLIAITNLAFNLMLTGVHERYLYHFYPFLFTALLGFDQLIKNYTPKCSLAAIAICATLYGGFVYSIMIDRPALNFGLAKDGPALTALHLGLFAFLLWKWRGLSDVFKETSRNLKPV